MARLLVVLGFVALAFAIFCVVDVILTDTRRIRALKKWIWVVIVIVLPVIGGLLWFILGKSRQDGSGQRRTIAPDDDPEFLGTLAHDEKRDEQQDERIRLLEEQLAELDDDDPKK